MPLSLMRATEAEKEVVDNLLQLYLHELSQFEDIEIADNGRFLYPHLQSYWEEAHRTPYLIRVKGKLAGFCLVRDEDDGTHSVAEFFILEAYRRLGIGEEVARMMFCLHPGPWQIGVLAENEVAIQFWRAVVRRFTSKQYRETSVTGWLGPVFRFKVPSACVTQDSVPPARVKV